MPPPPLPPWALDLLAEAPVGHMGMIDDRGAPRVLPVTFAYLAGTVWSAVDDKPKRVPPEGLARIRWLRARPRAALTVDHYDDDWSLLCWVQLLGEVTVVDAPCPDEAARALSAKYPQYAARPPQGPFLRLATARALSWP